MGNLAPLTDEEVAARIEKIKQQIAAGNLGIARRETATLLESAQDNAEVWYLTGYLSNNPIPKQQAFQRALQLDPNHKEAQEATVKGAIALQRVEEHPNAKGTFNRTAFIVGFVPAFFLGILGIAHLINGKNGAGAYFVAGITYLFLGRLLVIEALKLDVELVGVGLAVLPIHFFVAMFSSWKGATGST